MPKLHRAAYRFGIFLVGLVATIAYRLVIVLNNYNPFWLEVAWYIGTIGFMWYFGHRWLIENRRDKLIAKLSLADKIEKDQSLNAADREALTYILRGLSTSWARWNYIAIFFFSLLAIAYAIISRVIK